MHVFSWSTETQPNGMADKRSIASAKATKALHSFVRRPVGKITVWTKKAITWYKLKPSDAVHLKNLAFLDEVARFGENESFMLLLCTRLGHVHSPI